jgi:cysteinyl-tRNA synthetase
MSSTEAQTAPPTEVVYGIAKKMSLELEKFPLHTHGAVISMMTTMAKHREATLRQEQEAKMQAAQDAAMADALKAHADAQVERENQIADQIRREVAQANLKGEDTGKAPRLSIVLDKAGDSRTVDMSEKLACGCLGFCPGHLGQAKPAEELVTQ